MTHRAQWAFFFTFLHYCCCELFVPWPIGHSQLFGDPPQHYCRKWVKPSPEPFFSFAGQAQNFPDRSLSKSTVASTYSYMNQSALMSIIIGGTVAKQVQPLSLPDASSVNIQMQGSLLASIQASLQPPMPDTACHNHMILTFSNCCWSHLRPGALTWIESHESASFQQLDCNSAHTADRCLCTQHLWFVDIRLITRCNTDL